MSVVDIYEGKIVGEAARCESGMVAQPRVTVGLQHRLAFIVTFPF